MVFELREAWGFGRVLCLARKERFLTVGSWKSGEREGFRVLGLKKWVMIVRNTGRRAMAFTEEVQVAGG